MMRRAVRSVLVECGCFALTVILVSPIPATALGPASSHGTLVLALYLAAAAHCCLHSPFRTITAIVVFASPLNLPPTPLLCRPLYTIWRAPDGRSTSASPA